MWSHHVSIFRPCDRPGQRLSAATGGDAPAPSGGADLFASQGDEGTTLATIGDQRLTVEAMEKKINAMTPFVRARYQSKERRKEYIEHLMDKALLAQKAIRLNLHKDEKVIDTLQKRRWRKS